MKPQLLRDLLKYAEELVEVKLDDASDRREYGDEDGAKDFNRQVRQIEWNIKRARRELLKLAKSEAS
jgi:hypothetical protein